MLEQYNKSVASALISSITIFLKRAKGVLTFLKGISDSEYINKFMRVSCEKNGKKLAFRKNTASSSMVGRSSHALARAKNYTAHLSDDVDHNNLYYNQLGYIPFTPTL